MTRVVGHVFLGDEVDVSVDRIERMDDGELIVRLGRDEAQPAEDVVDPLQLVVHRQMGHTVGVHDLRTTQLHVGGIDFPAEHFVQRRCTRQEHGAFVLHGPLAQPHQIGSDTHCTAGHQGDGEDFLVGPGGFSGNHTAASEIFNAKIVFLPDDVRQLPFFFSTCAGNLGEGRGKELV